MNERQDSPVDGCDRESAVLAALAGDAWSSELRAHARTCASCQGAIEVWRHLQAEARAIDDDLRDEPLPHPGVIWWRRRILDEQAAARRLLWPVTVFPIVAAVLGLIALVTLTLWQQASHVSGPHAMTVVLAIAATAPIAWLIVSALYLRQRQ